MHHTRYSVTVIGGGPAGVAIVGELLFRKVNSIMWIDPEFCSGRLKNYPNVPSNTKVSLFLKYADQVARSFTVPITSEPAYKDLLELDQNSHCPLHYASSLVRMLSSRLRLVVDSTQASVIAITKDTGPWIASLQDEQVQSEVVILATGSHPRIIPEYRNVIPLDTALNTAQLPLLSLPKTTINVIGNSHSGMLVLKNLKEAGLKAVCYYRRPPLYALYPEGKQIIYDNTGLKGTAADWARQNWDGTEKSTLRCERYEEPVVQAIGFERNTLSIHYGGLELCARDLVRLKGAKLAYHSTLLEGLYGVGIAFPGVDKYEHRGEVITEESVGLFKFARHASIDATFIVNDLSGH